MYFQVGNTQGGEPAWWLYADNNRMVAWSGEAFASTSNARRACESFKAGAASARYESYVDAGSQWRWRAWRSSDKVASSGEAFVGQYEADTGGVQRSRQCRQGDWTVMAAAVEVRLGAFVDFVSANGRARLTVVRNAKTMYEQTYDPATDYWGPLRKATIKVFLEGWTKESPERLMEVSDDPKKLDNYRACVEGLRKFVGRKDITASRALRSDWVSGDLAVSVDPELTLAFGGTTFVTKLYFKKDEIQKRQVDAVLYLMSQTVAKGATPAILDMQRGRVVSPTVEIADMDVLLAGEAAAFSQMWQRL